LYRRIKPRVAGDVIICDKFERATLQEALLYLPGGGATCDGGATDDGGLPDPAGGGLGTIGGGVGDDGGDSGGAGGEGVVGGGFVGGLVIGGDGETGGLAGGFGTGGGDATFGGCAVDGGWPGTAAERPGDETLCAIATELSIAARTQDLASKIRYDMSGSADISMVRT
jgi:hypothetical protein